MKLTFVLKTNLKSCFTMLIRQKLSGLVGYKRFSVLPDHNDASKVAEIDYNWPKKFFCVFLHFAQKMTQNFLHFAKNSKRKKCAALVTGKPWCHNL